LPSGKRTTEVLQAMRKTGAPRSHTFQRTV
jgi:hypothetical protein